MGFTVSPLWETVTGVRALQLGIRLHLPWIPEATSCIMASADPARKEHLQLLTMPIRPTGFITDSLTHTSLRQDIFEAGLAAIAAVPLEFWVLDLGYLLAVEREENRLESIRA